MEARLLLVDEDPGVIEVLSEFLLRRPRTATARPTSPTAAELSLLLTVAVDLGDLTTVGRDAIADAVGAVGDRGAPPA
jgi:hypothetical protein